MIEVVQHLADSEQSVMHLLKLMAAHDLVHRRQIERILAAVARSG